MTPEGWSTATLGSLTELITKGTTPTTNGLAYTVSGVPFLRVESITRSGALDLSRVKFISEDAHRILFRSQVRPGDILVSIAGALGRACIIPPELGRANINQAVSLVRLGSHAAPRVEREFIKHALGGPGVQEQVRRGSAQLAQANLNLKQVGELSVNLPPIGEQRKIAAILSSVDDAIEATRAVIEQLQVVKKAMMAELLTRGLPGRHTRFKQTEVGEVPASWEIVSVADIGRRDRPTAQTGPFGAQLKPQDFADTGVPVLKIGNVRAGHLRLTDLDYVTAEKALELDRYRVEAGDLLFARQGATTGRNALATEECSGWLINYHIIRVSVDRGRCLPRFLMSCFNSDLVQRQVGREKGRGNRDGINTANILSFRIPLPRLDEQLVITNGLTAIEQSVDVNLSTVAQLQVSKSALMSILLTGELRVTPDEDAA